MQRMALTGPSTVSATAKRVTSVCAGLPLATTAMRTASGSHYDGSQMIVAHRTLPFGTKLKVMHGGRSVTVVVLDRGPFIRGRELDLSHAAAKKLGMIDVGVASVCWVKL